MGQSTSTPKINKTDQAVFKLKLQRDTLIKYNTSLSYLINADISAAKAALSQNNRQRALLHVKRRKAHQELLGKTLAQIDALEDVIGTIQFKVVERDFLQHLQEGNRILKVLNRECSVDRVERVMEETGEQVEAQNEASEMLAGGLVASVSDEDIEEDLAALEQEVARESGEKQKESREKNVADKLGSIPKTNDIPLFPEVDVDKRIEEGQKKEQEQEQKQSQREERKPEEAQLA